MNITLYSTPTCPFCQQVKSFLQKHSVAFVEYDVSHDQKKAEEMIKKSGQMGVPVLDIEGELVIGFDEKKLEEVLEV